MKLTESKALARIAAYCSKAERCEYDVRKKLIGWELDSAEQNRIIDRLKKEKFLDEKRFCESFVRDKARFNKWGKVKIAFELKKKYISQSLIDSSLAELDDTDLDETLMQILKTKNKSTKAENDYQRRTKLLRFALGRGFSMQQSLKAINSFLGQSEDEF